MNSTKDNRISEGQRRSLFYIFKSMRFDEEMRHDFISDYTDGRTDSMKELGYIEAQSMIRYLQELNRMPQTRKDKPELDTYRKRVIKAISQYFKCCGKGEVSMEYIKATAVRATGLVPTETNHDFNRISKAALVRIYNEFCRKQEVSSVRNRERGRERELSLERGRERELETENLRNSKIQKK